jgi:SAM-dependent methyltransferase
MARILTHDEAKVFYDRFGVRQDSQAIYEDRATAALIAHGDFAKARAVFEFGCGTGRFAELLLARHLPEDCSYRAVDISTTMADLARRRLARWGDRTEVRRTTGAMDVPAVEASCDRFIACYVLDLLGEDDIRALIAEARRLLVPSGLLCATGLTPGRSVPARLVMGARRLPPRRGAALSVGGRVADPTPRGRRALRHQLGSPGGGAALISGPAAARGLPPEPEGFRPPAAPFGRKGSSWPLRSPWASC